MIPIGRISSATLKDLGAYDIKRERIAKMVNTRRRKQSSTKRRSIGKRSLPTSLERRMPGAEQYDGFSMRKKGKGMRKTKKRRNKMTHKIKRKRRRNTRR
jgi:hypothetical protein